MTGVTTHEYVVTYYGTWSKNIGIVHPSWQRPFVIWKNILTNEVERHDGPCIIRFFDDASILHYKAVYSPNRMTTIPNITWYEVDDTDLMHRYNGATDFFIQYPEAPIEHQYIVSYLEDKISTRGIARFVTWRNILTGALDRHDGPAMYATSNTERYIHTMWYEDNVYIRGKMSAYPKDV